jgi:hypothetical protein
LIDAPGLDTSTFTKVRALRAGRSQVMCGPLAGEQRPLALQEKLHTMMCGGLSGPLALHPLGRPPCTAPHHPQRQLRCCGAPRSSTGSPSVRAGFDVRPPGVSERCAARPGFGERSPSNERLKLAGAPMARTGAATGAVAQLRNARLCGGELLARSLPAGR